MVKDGHLHENRSSVPGADYDHEREILTPLKLTERQRWDCLLLARVSQMLKKGWSPQQLLGRRVISSGSSFTIGCSDRWLGPGGSAVGVKGLHSWEETSLTSPLGLADFLMGPASAGRLRGGFG